MKRRPTWLDRRISAPGPYLCLCLDEHTFARAMDDMNIVGSRPAFQGSAHSDATTHMFAHHDGSLACIVTLGPWAGRTPVEVAGLLVHEAAHVWQEYCQHIGERKPGIEQEAYGIQAIAQELMQSFVEQTKC